MLVPLAPGVEMEKHDYAKKLEVEHAALMVFGEKKETP